jgi:hypothetical protein
MLKRFVTVDRYPLEKTFGRAIVADRPMLRATVVPHRYRVSRPVKPATEVRNLNVSVKKAQQGRALGRVNTFD